MTSRSAFCFDFDGTITRRELLPLIGAEIGLYEEINALTHATIKGVLPFDSAFKLRCRLLAEVPVSRVSAIAEKVPTFERITGFIKRRPADCFIVTGNLDVWVMSAAKKICPNVFASTARADGDRLIEIGTILNKADAIKEVRKTHDKIVAVGDGLGDVNMLEAADTAIAFGGLHTPVESLLQVSDVVCPSEQALLNVLEQL